MSETCGRAVAVGLDEAALRALRPALARAGFGLAGQAGDGPSGLRLLGALQPALAVAGAVMPVMDGAAFVRAAAALRLQVRPALVLLRPPGLPLPGLPAGGRGGDRRAAGRRRPGPRPFATGAGAGLAAARAGREAESAAGRAGRAEPSGPRVPGAGGGAGVAGLPPAAIPPAGPVPGGGPGAAPLPRPGGAGHPPRDRRGLAHRRDRATAQDIRGYYRRKARQAHLR